jgi:hypothetical protein
MRILRVLCSATRTHSEGVSRGQTARNTTHLLNNIGAEFLNRKCTDIPGELTNYGITETIIIQVENILDNLGKQGALEQSISNKWIAVYIVAVRILNKGKRIISDLVDKLDALMI